MSLVLKVFLTKIKLRSLNWKIVWLRSIPIWGDQISISMKSVSPFRATVGSASSLHVEKLLKVGWDFYSLWRSGRLSKAFRDTECLCLAFWTVAIWLSDWLCCSLLELLRLAKRSFPSRCRSFGAGNIVYGVYE